jgi:branched-chain amino acid transport system permease protein
MTTNSTSLPAPGARVASRAASRLLGLAILVALLGAPFVLDNYYLHAVIISMIFLLPAHGLNLIVGYLGMLSLAQGAFFGIGSYVSALAAIHFGTPFYVNFILAGVVTGLIALPLGIPALRLRTYSFVMCTLGFVVIGEAVAKNWVGLTRGDMGLSAVPQPVLGFGAHPFTITTITGYYYLYLLIAALMTGLFYALVASPAGRSMIAIRDNEVQAEAFGIPTWNYKLVVFTISAAFAGFGGSLYAHYLTTVSPLTFQMFY